MSARPVALSPQWLGVIREKGLTDGDFHNLSLLMALYSHRNDDTGQCCPSVDRLACLIGMGKSAILAGIAHLRDLGWIDFQKVPTANGRERYEYTLQGHANTQGAFVFPATMLTGGLWAFMTPAQRKVWLKLRAHSVHGANVVPDGFIGGGEGLPSEDVLDCLAVGWHWSDFWFIPEYSLEPDVWAAQLRMSRRTLTECIQGLVRLHALATAAVVCDDAEPGLILLTDPAPPDTKDWRKHVAKFEQRLADAKKPQSTRAAKRIVSAVKNQQIKLVAQPEPITCGNQN